MSCYIPVFLVSFVIVVYPVNGRCKRTTILHKTLLQSGKNALGNLKCRMYFLESRKQEEHKFLICFLRSKLVWPPPKMLNTWDTRQQSKQMKMWTEWSSLSLKTEESLSARLLTCCKFNLVQFRPENWNSGAGFSTMTLHVLTLFGLCTNLCYSTPSLLTRFTVMWLLSFPRPQDVLTGRTYNDTSTSQAKLWDALAEF